MNHFHLKWFICSFPSWAWGGGGGAQVHCVSSRDGHVNPCFYIIQHNLSKMLLIESRPGSIKGLHSISAFHWLHIKFRIKCKFLVVTFRSQYGQGPAKLAHKLWNSVLMQLAVNAAVDTADCQTELHVETFICIFIKKSFSDYALYLYVFIFSFISFVTSLLLKGAM